MLLVLGQGLEDDVGKKLLLVPELVEELLYVGLMQFQWLKLITKVVAGLSVFVIQLF